MSATRLSIQDLLDNPTGPVWVLNTAHKAVEHGGEIHITIPRANGNPVFIHLPKSWIPENLVEHAPRKDILDSTYFMAAVKNESITLITDEEAQRLLARPAASDERRRLDQKKAAIQAATASRGLSKNVTISGGSDEDDGDTPATPTSKGLPKKNASISMANLGEDGSEPGDAPETVRPNFRAWVAQINNLTQEEASNELKIRAELSEDEAAYLRDKTKHPKIKAFLDAQLG